MSRTLSPPDRPVHALAGPRLVVAGVAMTLLAAACGGSSSAGTTNAAAGQPTAATGASSAGTLVVYSGRNEKLVGPLLADFTKATGIAVTASYGNSAEKAAQLLEEGDRTPADVFVSQDAGALGALEQAGRLAALELKQLEKVPDRFRSGNGRWVGVSGRARVLIYNPTLVVAQQLPTTVYDLTQPAYRGKVAIAPTNASFQAFVTGMRVVDGEARTREFLQGLKANEPKTFEGNAQIVDAVDKGEIAMGLVNHYYLYEKADEAGGLDKLTARNYSFPGNDPGSLVNVAGVGVLAGQGSAQSKAFVDFLLSEQAQRYFAQETKEYPLIKGVATAPGLTPLESLGGPEVDLSKLDTLEQTLALLSEVGLT